MADFKYLDAKPISGGVGALNQQIVDAILANRSGEILGAGITHAGESIKQSRQFNQKLDAYKSENEQERIQDTMLRAASQKVNYDFALQLFDGDKERAAPYLDGDPHEAGLNLRAMVGMGRQDPQMSALKRRQDTAHIEINEGVRQQALDPMDVPGLRRRADMGDDLSSVIGPQVKAAKKANTEQASRESMDKKLRSIAGKLSNMGERTQVFGYASELDDLALSQSAWEKLATDRLGTAQDMEREQKKAEQIAKETGESKPGRPAGPLSTPPSPNSGPESFGGVAFSGAKGASPTDGQLGALGKAIAGGGDMDTILGVAGWELDDLSEEDYARLAAAVLAAKSGGAR